MVRFVDYAHFDLNKWGILSNIFPLLVACALEDCEPYLDPSRDSIFLDNLL